MFKQRESRLKLNYWKKLFFIVLFKVFNKFLQKILDVRKNEKLAKGIATLSRKMRNLKRHVLYSAPISILLYGTQFDQLSSTYVNRRVEMEKITLSMEAVCILLSLIKFISMKCYITQPKKKGERK